MSYGTNDTDGGDPFAQKFTRLKVVLDAIENLPSGVLDTPVAGGGDVDVEDRGTVAQQQALYNALAAAKHQALFVKMALQQIINGQPITPMMGVDPDEFEKFSKHLRTLRVDQYGAFKTPAYLNQFIEFAAMQRIAMAIANVNDLSLNADINLTLVSPFQPSSVEDGSTSSGLKMQQIKAVLLVIGGQVGSQEQNHTPTACLQARVVNTSVTHNYHLKDEDYEKVKTINTKVCDQTFCPDAVSAFTQFLQEGLVKALKGESSPEAYPDIERAAKRWGLANGLSFYYPAVFGLIRLANLAAGDWNPYIRWSVYSAIAALAAIPSGVANNGVYRSTRAAIDIANLDTDNKALDPGLRMLFMQQVMQRRGKLAEVWAWFTRIFGELSSLPMFANDILALPILVILDEMELSTGYSWALGLTLLAPGFLMGLCARSNGDIHTAALRIALQRALNYVPSFISTPVSYIGSGGASLWNACVPHSLSIHQDTEAERVIKKVNGAIAEKIGSKISYIMKSANVAAAMARITEITDSQNISLEDVRQLPNLIQQLLKAYGVDEQVIEAHGYCYKFAADIVRGLEKTGRIVVGVLGTALAEWGIVTYGLGVGDMMQDGVKAYNQIFSQDVSDFSDGAVWTTEFLSYVPIFALVLVFTPNTMVSLFDGLMNWTMGRVGEKSLSKLLDPKAHASAAKKANAIAALSGAPSIEASLVTITADKFPNPDVYQGLLYSLIIGGFIAPWIVNGKALFEKLCEDIIYHLERHGTAHQKKLIPIIRELKKLVSSFDEMDPLASLQLYQAGMYQLFFEVGEETSSTAADNFKLDLSEILTDEEKQLFEGLMGMNIAHVSPDDMQGEAIDIPLDHRFFAKLTEKAKRSSASSVSSAYSGGIFSPTSSQRSMYVQEDDADDEEQMLVRDGGASVGKKPSYCSVC